MSGAAGRYDDRLEGDVHIGTLPNGRQLFTAEVKARKSGAGFKTLEKWLGDNDLLFLRRNNANAIVAMPWATFIDLMQCYYEENK
jgi:hypothetical protein